MSSKWRRLAVAWWMASLLFVTASAHADSAIEPVPPDAAWEDVRALAAFVDEQLAARWERAGIAPAESADDAEWLRRVYLDLSGVIPSVWEAREFLASDEPHRREQVVDRLLAGPAHATHFAETWRKALVPEVNTNPNLRFIGQSFELWLRNQFVSGRPYDEAVRDLLSFEFPPEGAQAQSYYAVNFNEPSPIVFYAAKDPLAEDLAAVTARALLGLRLECAQCHDHPFADWRQDQFWQLAAFFGGLKRQNENNIYSPIQEDKAVRAIAVEGSDRMVEVALFDGSVPEWTDDASPRAVLAEWATSRDNPYFARATVNRLWALLFGVGLVDPVDDFEPGNPPSHPQILDRLAEEFAAHDFDLQFVLRALVSTRAYQLTSRVTDPTQTKPREFAVMPVRGLSGEQLFDSIARAVGNRAADFTSARGNASALARTQFTETFQDQSDRPTDYESSILQALTLMNGGMVTSATGDNSRTLMAAVDLPGLSTAGRLDTLFLATVSRYPTDEERERLLEYVENGKSQNALQELGDVFWSLLNSSEFVFNH